MYGRRYHVPRDRDRGHALKEASKRRSRAGRRVGAYPARSLSSTKPIPSGGPRGGDDSRSVGGAGSAACRERAGRLCPGLGAALMRQELAAAWAAQAPLRPVANCPVCGAGESRPAGRKARQVETVFGPVALSRQRRRCAECGRHYQPDDAMLGPELGAGQLSPHLRELTALCGASWPYRQAAELLGRLRGRPLSAETVRAVVGTIGSAVAATQAQEAAA